MKTFLIIAMLVFCSVNVVSSYGNSDIRFFPSGSIL
jgi:hypothetical protein